MHGYKGKKRSSTVWKPCRLRNSISNKISSLIPSCPASLPASPHLLFPEPPASFPWYAPKKIAPLSFYTASYPKHGPLENWALVESMLKRHALEIKLVKIYECADMDYNPSVEWNQTFESEIYVSVMCQLSGKKGVSEQRDGLSLMMLNVLMLKRQLSGTHGPAWTLG